MNRKLIKEIKDLISKNKDNSISMTIGVDDKNLSFTIIDEEKEEARDIYSIDLKYFINELLNEDLELDWF